MNRIRIEKMRALKLIKERNSARNRKGEVLSEFDKMIGREELYTAEQIEPTSYYKENIFSVEDYYLYRAISNFYLEDFAGALEVCIYVLLE